MRIPTSIAGIAPFSAHFCDTSSSSNSLETDFAADLITVYLSRRYGQERDPASDCRPAGSAPAEECSGERRRLGHISKPGNARLRFLLAEAAQVTMRSAPEWRSKDFYLAMRRGRKIAKVGVSAPHDAMPPDTTLSADGNAAELRFPLAASPQFRVLAQIRDAGKVHKPDGGFHLPD